MEGKNKTRNRPGGVFKVGAIALAFLITGYQAALFITRAAVTTIVANHDHPDTVYIYAPAPAADSAGHVPDAPETTPGAAVRISSGHSEAAIETVRRHARRKVESFRFDPNTVSVEDLMRLGFSEKQAQSIDNYRKKGGRFRRKGDFAKSYVVSDSVYERLAPYIDIPLIDINKADSAAFDTLPGIGGWFASKMVEYRGRLHGYSCPEQLMEIYNFDEARYEGLKDLITCSPAAPYPLWSAPADSIREHPHVQKWQTARAIVLYRENNPRENWTVDGLLKAGIITEAQASGLRRCRLE